MKMFEDEHQLMCVSVETVGEDCVEKVDVRFRATKTYPRGVTVRMERGLALKFEVGVLYSVGLVVKGELPAESESPEKSEGTVPKFEAGDRVRITAGVWSGATTELGTIMAICRSKVNPFEYSVDRDRDEDSFGVGVPEHWLERV